jgi:hypothetical protein
MTNYKNIQLLETPHTNEPDVLSTAQIILNATDWTQLPDSGLTDACVQLFVAYRNDIRTIRKTNPSSPTWPDAPTEEWL